MNPVINELMGDPPVHSRLRWSEVRSPKILSGGRRVTRMLKRQSQHRTKYYLGEKPVGCNLREFNIA